MLEKKLIARSNKAEYHYDHENQIFYKIYMDMITLEDIVRSWEYVFRENLIPPGTRGFVLDNAELRMHPGESHGINEFYDRHLDVFRNRKIGLIMEKPDQVIFPMLVAAERPMYYPRAFCTKEAAEEWVLG